MKNSSFFVDLIDKNNITIIGSFMLKLITGDDWKNNDIDIFTKYEKDNYGDINELPFIKEVKQYFNVSKNESVNMNNYKGLGFSDLFYINIEGLRFNVIMSNRLTALKLIEYTFDTDICKIAYNKNKLYVRNWLKIIYKRDCILPCSSLNYAIKKQKQK